MLAAPQPQNVVVQPEYAAAAAMHDRASIKLDGEPVRSALICIASFFRNDTRRNDLLLDTIHTILSWRIERIKIVVNTNDAAALQHVLQSHNEVEVVQAEFAHRKMLSQGFLAWEHRKAIDRLAPTSSEFDLYGYLEDDARLTWEAVVSWAADESFLSRHAAREVLWHEIPSRLLSLREIAALRPTARL